MVRTRTEELIDDTRLKIDQAVKNLCLIVSGDVWGANELPMETILKLRLTLTDLLRIQDRIGRHE